MQHCIIITALKVPAQGVSYPLHVQNHNNSNANEGIPHSFHPKKPQNYDE